MASMTEGQVVWICVASVGLSAFSNSRNLFGRMQHLQCSSEMRVRDGIFYRGQERQCPAENAGYASPALTVLRELARRVGGWRWEWATSGPLHGHGATSFSRSFAGCRALSPRR